MGSSERITVVVDQDLEEIVPGYLVNRQKDLIAIPEALKNDDFDVIRTLGHRMKGSGAGYGFAQITDIGKRLEEAAKGSDAKQIADLNVELSSYLSNVDIVYEKI
jgi:HPt (histidine-containing phosphotransfer) domain-containing protein